jgi:hypothetical protein
MMSLTAACAPLSPAVRALADQGEASVLIRDGFVVPTGQLLRVDDMSVDCVIASEVFNQQEFNKFGVVCRRCTLILGPNRYILGAPLDPDLKSPSDITRKQTHTLSCYALLY